MDTVNGHWTVNKLRDFVYRITSDFVTQLQVRLEEKQIDQKDYAKMIGVTEGRVSQVFNSPGNFTVEKLVEYARPLGLKVAVIAYDDGDPKNNHGPIGSSVFHAAWKYAGSPRDLGFMQPEMVTMTAASQVKVTHKYPSESVSIVYLNPDPIGKAVGDA